MKSNLIVSLFSALSTLLIALYSLSILSTHLSIYEFSQIADLLLFVSMIALFDVIKAPTVELLNSLTNNKKEVISTVLYLAIVFSVFVSFVFYFITWLFIDMSRVESLSLTFSVFFYMLNSALWGILDGLQKVKLTITVRALGWMIFYSIFLLNMKLKINLYFLAPVITSLFMLTVQCFYLFYKLKIDVKFRLEKNIYALLKVRMAALFSHFSLSLIFANFERITSKLLFDTQTYSAVSAFSELALRLSFVSRIVQSAVYPKACMYYNQKKKRVLKMVYHYIELFYLFISLIIIIILSLYSETLIDFYFGAKYVKFHNIFYFIIVCGTFKLYGYQAVLRLNVVGDFTTQVKFYFYYLPILLVTFSLLYLELINLSFSIFLIKSVDLFLYLYSRWIEND